MKNIVYKIHYLVLGLFMLLQNLHAQYAITDMSRYIAGSDAEGAAVMKVVGGYTYIYSSAISNDLPIMNGSAMKGSNDVYLAKYDNAGNMVFATYFGGTNGEGSAYRAMEVVGNDIYFVGTTSSTDLPVTNGSVHANAGNPNAYTDVFLTKINTLSGNISFSTYFGGSDVTETILSFKVDGSGIYLLTKLNGANFPVTNGSTYQGNNDLGLTKFNVGTGSMIWSTYWGGDGTEGDAAIEISGNTVYISGSSTVITPSTFTSTDGTSIQQGGSDYYYGKIDANSGAKTFLTFLGGTGNEVFNSLKVVAGEAYIYGSTTSANFPSTDGSSFHYSPSIFIPNKDIAVAKYKANNALDYATIIGGYGDELFSFGSNFTGLEVNNGNVFIFGGTYSTDYPVTDGTIPTISLSPIAKYFVTKLNTTGAIAYSTLLGGSGDMDVIWPQFIKVDCNDNIYVLGHTSSNLAYPVTNGSTLLGGGGLSYNVVLTKLNTTTGKILFSTYYGSNQSNLPSAPPFIFYPSVNVISMELLGNGKVQFFGTTDAVDLPVTVAGNVPSFKNDLILTRMNTCPTGFTGSTAVSPSTQTVCVNSATTQISMAAAIIPGSAMPTVYKNGVATLQNDIPARYQWQEATSPAGPWTDITNAVGQNFTPSYTNVNKYYRRLVSTTCCATTTVEQTGDVASVLVSSNVAPTVNAGGVFITCPSTVITLGGSPTATPASGSSIVSYSWSPGASGAYSPNNTVANPSVTPTTSTVYTVLVTDNNGCKSSGSAIVNVLSANAGPDVSACNGQNVRIGSVPIAGLAGVVYSWTASPADPSMTCTNCAQPSVNPAVTTTYTLYLTIPVTGGGTCTTTDDVIVTPSTGPVTANFAGTDKVICMGNNTPLGTTAESGFSYVWAPGNYLPSNTTSSTFFTPGSLAMPNPNPGLYYLTAIKNGCSYVDEVETAVIEARAGVDGCGPRLVGKPDRTPSINETYSWAKISGPGNFAGVTNQPEVPVTASVGGPTTYELTVSYTLNGVSQSCTDQVVVPDCGCVVDIDVVAPFSCPIYSLNGGVGSVKLVATAADIFSTDPSVFTYSWSPNVGLSAYSGREVYLTDNVNRTYTVTMGSPFDTSFHCTQTVEVNHPAWSLPVFTAQDVTACPSTSINIGQATVAGYAYAWKPLGGGSLSANNISNPTASSSSTTNFAVLVTDIGSGCTKKDTATLTISDLPANPAGSNFTLCGATSNVILGSSPVASVTYSWSSSPTGAIFSPNNTVPNPTVNISSTTTFNVTATNLTTGCTTSDAVTVTVNPAVTPFSFTNQTFCPSTAGAIPLPAGPGGMTTYSWQPYTKVVNPGSNGPTATTKNPPPQSETTYTLTVTNASGCTASASVTYTPIVSIPDAGSDKVLCLNGGAIALGSASNPTGGGITYSWTPSTGLSNATIPNPTFVLTAAGVFGFRLTKTESACSTIDSVTVNVLDFAIPNLSSPNICKGASVQIGSTPAVGASYVWTPATALSNPNIANPIASPATTTAYTVIGVGLNGCSSTQNIVVNVSNTLAPLVSIPTVTACLGQNNVILNPSVAPAGTYNYSWTPNNGTLSNIYVINPEVYIGGVGTSSYTLTVTDPSTTCSNTATTQVTVQSCQSSTNGSVGNYVWHDTNGNGLADDGTSAGINGIAVQLWSVGTDNAIGGGDDVMLQNTTTATNLGNPGYYNFSITTTGNYYVKFPTSSGAFILTTATTTAATDNNSDANTSTGNSPMFTININGSGTAKNNPTIDAGFNCPNGCIPVSVIKK